MSQRESSPPRAVFQGAEGGDGGAIYNRGDLVVEGESLFKDNQGRVRPRFKTLLR